MGSALEEREGGGVVVGGERDEDEGRRAKGGAVLGSSGRRVYLQRRPLHRAARRAAETQLIGLRKDVSLRTLSV